MLWQCPKLTPLQSRLLASVSALALLALLYWSVSSPHFAYAAELEVDGSGLLRGGKDHNWHRIAEERLKADGIDLGEDEVGVREFGYETLELRQAQVEAKDISGNNIANKDNIQPGNNTVWRYPRSLLNEAHTEVGPGLPENATSPAEDNVSHVELRRRSEETEAPLQPRQNSERRVYISVNTCLQPTYNSSGAQTSAPPQLTLYVATGSNRNPGPSADASSQDVRPLSEGFTRYSFTTTRDTYISVSAPSLPDQFVGVWNYELAVSIDDYYHAADLGYPDLFLVDSDNAAALLVTANLTQANSEQESYKQWMALTAPYGLFASNVNDTRTLGVRNSYCGLDTLSQLASDKGDLEGTTSHVQMSMITRGEGRKPKEQFYISALNASSQYLATLALEGNSTNSGDGVVGGGGKVWQPVKFATKTDNTCGLLYDLDFCDEVAYAVPSHPDVDYRALYDNYTRFYYQYFNYSLQQVPCEAPRDAKYSLAKSCTDCENAYKEWLCAVSIPRCEDYSNQADFLMPRNMGQAFQNGSTIAEEELNAPFWPMPRAPSLEGSVAFQQTYGSSVATNSSRNRMIDEDIHPGPYKEVLPCEDLCYSLMQACPPTLGFGCPFKGKGLNVSYGTRKGNGNGTITCSYLGAYVYTGDGAGLGVQGVRVLGLALVVGLVFMI